MNITRHTSQDDHDVSKYMVRYGNKLTKHLDNLRCLFSEHHSWIIENETLKVLQEHHFEIIQQMIFEKVKKKQLELYVKSIRAMINQLDGHAAKQEGDEGDDDELDYEQLKIDTKIYIKCNKWQLWFWKSDQRYFKWDYGLQQLCRPIHSVDHLHYVLEQLLDIADIVLPSDYLFFREGIKPKWEDKANCEGGSWIVEFDRNNIDSASVSQLWKQLLTMVMEPDQEDVLQHVCGVKISMRFKNYLFSVWFRDFTNLPANVTIGNMIAHILEKQSVTDKAKVFYRAHKVAEKNAILKERLKFGISHSVPL